MSWVYEYKPKGQTVLEFFRKLWEDEDVTVLDGAVVNFREFYCVIEAKKESGEVIRYGVVALLDYRYGQELNFGFNERDENEGPTFYNCPERLLDLLEDYPSDYDYAMKWRQKCRETAERKRSKKIKPGQSIYIEKGLRFEDGMTRKKFTFQGRNIFVDNHGMKCKIPNIASFDFEVVA